MEKTELVKIAKEKHSGNLFWADYKFTDIDGQDKHLQFVYREPQEDEMDGYSSQAEKSQNGANRALMQKLIVAPAATEVMNVIGDYPGPVSTFIQGYLNPLSGLTKEVQPFEKL